MDEATRIDKAEYQAATKLEKPCLRKLAKMLKSYFILFSNIVGFLIWVRNLSICID